MKKKLVIDNNSLINFFRYYCFDKYNEKGIYSKLIDFLITKTKSDEIIIIDKVFNELHGNVNFKNKIKSYVKDTLFLFEKVQDLIDKYYIKSNEKFVNYDRNEIEIIIRKYEEKDADLYLVAYCNYLKNQTNIPILITEETKKSYNKLIEKIPTICLGENIEYRKLPYLMFEIYKDELKFKLDIELDK